MNENWSFSSPPLPTSPLPIPSSSSSSPPPRPSLSLSTSPSTHQRDPSGRRLSFHLPHISSAPSDAQARRRDQALIAQRERRQHAFMSARDTAGFGLDEMEDLVLGDVGDDDEEWEDQEVVEEKEKKERKRRKSVSIGVGGAGVNGTNGKAKRLYKTWAKNVLMWAETLDLSKGLPHELGSAWSAVVVPKGKRCLCMSGSNSPNTILLSRVSGRTLEKRQSTLPPDCMVDGVWDSELSVLWVMDLIKWRGTWFLECETEMRFFFLHSRLTELPPQTHSPFPVAPSSSIKSPKSPILLLPVPALSPPLTGPSLLSLSTSLNTSSLFPASVLLSTSLSPLTPTTVEIPFQPTGLLLYLAKAHYESGLTALAGWIPVEVDEDEKRVAGLERFLELLEEERVGGMRIG